MLKIHVMKTPPYSVGSYRAYNVVISSMNCCEIIYKFYVWWSFHFIPISWRFIRKCKLWHVLRIPQNFSMQNIMKILHLPLLLSDNQEAILEELENEVKERYCIINIHVFCVDLFFHKRSFQSLSYSSQAHDF